LVTKKHARVKMQATYSLNSNELTSDFLNSIKSIFKNKNINITISDDTKLHNRSEELQHRVIITNYK